VSRRAEDHDGRWHFGPVAGNVDWGRPACLSRITPSAWPWC